ncbi:SMI1/KNR4 family protein [Paenibacillus lactis]|uniref:SMI1/KNR4 family protein n=1 Tax=Paenibacillus lactis TaxID=228574 RepID=UPI0036C21EB5
MSPLSNLTWRFVKGKVSYEDIMRLEGHFQVRFPELYATTILSFHGGRPKPNRFDTEQSKGYVFKSLLPISHRYSSSMIEVYEWIGNRLPTGCIPFASDPTGNYICFNYAANPRNPQVVLWNHETGQCEVAAPSFVQFMHGLY